MEEKVFHKITEISQKPAVLIIDGDNFINSFLKKALSLYGCQVFFSSGPFKKEGFKNYDYIFCFSKEWLKIKEILGLVDQKTKLLLALKLTPEQSLPESKIFQYCQERKINVRVVCFASIYGPGMDAVEFQKLARQAKTITPQPIFVSDFIYGLFKAMFANKTKGKIFSLIEEEKKLGWRPKVSFEQGLKQTKVWFEKRKIKETEKIPKKKTKLPAIIVLVIFLVFSYPFSSLAFYGFFGSRSLKQAKTAILAGNLSLADRKASQAQSFFEKGKNQTLQLSGLLGFFSEQKNEQLNDFFYLGETVAEGVKSFTQAADMVGDLLSAILQEKPADFNKLTKEIKLELEKSFNQLSLAESQSVQTGQIRNLDKMRDLILQAKKGVELLPKLIGLERKQSYLVLFQNNSELRPTGGFIGSYGLLTFDEGQLIDFEVKDVYSADGQLKGHVEPPVDLKKYLGEAGWYLRDSNWDPDFPTSAARAAWFLEKETGRKVDGVFGINLFSLQRILEITGEIQIPDYQEKINASNFFERAEYYSEINFFPGSTQKQEFLGSVARVLFEKVKTDDQQLWFSLARNFYPLLKSKDVMVWLTDPQAMKIVMDLDWGGRVKNVKCQMSNVKCINDYLMVVEANVGINKANYFLKRSFSHQVKIEEGGEIKETLRLDYQNTSQSEAFPGGRYKTYIRVYTPLKSELVKIVIKNPQTKESKEWLRGAESDFVGEIKEEHGKQVFGFLLEIPPQENRSVEVAYQLAEKFTQQTEQYLFLLQKQSGIKDEVFSFWLTPPRGVVAFSKTIKATQTADGLVFSPKFDQDLIFEIGLGRW